MIIPIMIPSRHEPARCPHCKNLETIKEICWHCGYEYPEDDSNFPVSLGWLILLFVGGGAVIGFNVSPSMAFWEPTAIDYVLGTLFGAVVGFATLMVGGLTIVFLHWLISETFGGKE